MKEKFLSFEVNNYIDFITEHDKRNVTPQTSFQRTIYENYRKRNVFSTSLLSAPKIIMKRPQSNEEKRSDKMKRNEKSIFDQSNRKARNQKSGQDMSLSMQEMHQKCQHHSLNRALMAMQLIQRLSLQ